MAVLDTSFLIDLERERPSALKRLKALEADGVPLRVPPATWIEYLARLDPPRRAAVQKEMESSTFFEPLGREMADQAVRLQAELSQRGKPMGWHDLQIAAAALFLREPLVSNDGVFHQVPGLEVLDH